MMFLNSNKTMKQTALGLFFLAIALLGGMQLYLDHIQSEAKQIQIFKLKQSKKLNNKNLIINQTWRKDIERLIKNGEIPVAWGQISQVVFHPTDPLTTELASFLQAPVKINKEGVYRLEVSIITHQSEQNRTQILLQHNIVDIQSEDTIWELNKTYNLTSN